MKNELRFSWRLLSLAFLGTYAALQVIHWSMLPQFMDIYYHLLTAWGFQQAGGFSTWDFWQFAPLGRPHIYPPLFHFLLAIPLSLGISPIIIAQFTEAVLPTLFMVVLWRVVRGMYGERLAFFTLVCFCSSNLFFLSLVNHAPATLALVFLVAALGSFHRGNCLRAMVGISLCFYTHIGVAWQSAAVFLIYAFVVPDRRKECLRVLGWAVFCSLPMIVLQCMNIGSISALGLALNESKLIQVKIIEYVLAAVGFWFSWKKGGSYRIPGVIFIASAVFLTYPYRFFCGEGFLAIILLAAFGWEAWYQRIAHPYARQAFLACLVFISVLLSPTMILPKDGKGITFATFDSSFVNLVASRTISLWLPESYLPIAKLVRDNSSKDDIIFATLPPVGMAVASITHRATANALFPEIKATKVFDPFSVSKIEIFTKFDFPDEMEKIISFYGLRKLGETKEFVVYKNEKTMEKVRPRKAQVPFGIAGIVIVLAAWRIMARKRQDG